MGRYALISAAWRSGARASTAARHLTARRARWRYLSGVAPEIPVPAAFRGRVMIGGSCEVPLWRKPAFAAILTLLVLRSAISLSGQASAPIGPSNIITTVVGAGWQFPLDESSGVAGTLGDPFRDSSGCEQGNVYIADASNDMVMQVLQDGTLEVLAGNGVSGYSGDGGPAAARLIELSVRASQWTAPEMSTSLTHTTIRSAKSPRTASLPPSLETDN